MNRQLEEARLQTENRLKDMEFELQLLQLNFRGSLRKLKGIQRSIVNVFLPIFLGKYVKT